MDAAATELRLDGRVALITGAGSRSDGIGTGRAIAVTLARAGARVCLLDVSADAAQVTLDMIEDEGGDAFAVTGDVTVAADCNQAVADAVGHFGRLDMLVNNVGTGDGGSFDSVDEATWDRGMAVNLKSVFLMAKAAVPEFRKNPGGSIVNISSIAGLLSASKIPYGASKAGMIMLTKDLAHDLGPEGIRVNAVAPGHIYTPMVSWKTTDEERDLRRRVSPLGIEGDAWDIANATAFLMSDAARFITGVVLPVDGGTTQILPRSGVRLVRSREQSESAKATKVGAVASD